MIDVGLYAAYALMIVGVVTAIVLPLMNILKSPGEIKKALYGIIGFVVLFGISYFLSGSNVTADQVAKGITEYTSKMVGAGLTMFYLVFAVAIIGLIYSEISKALK
jgi:hypothetical protein